MNDISRKILLIENVTALFVPSIIDTRPARILNSCECKICGAPARYSYYGAIACESCKMFFKRNAENRRAILKCDFGNECEINIKNRHICSSCRLKKCFESGMCIEMIRASRCKKNDRNTKRKLTINSTSTALVTRNNKNRLKQLPILNLIQLNQKIFSIEQRNLLSNLIHCFDEHSGSLFVQQFIKNQNGLPHELNFEYSSVKDFITSIKGKIQFIIEKNRDFLSLSLDDRFILLQTTVEHTTSLGGMFTLRQHHLFDYASFYKSTEMIFRPSAAAFARRVINQFDSDETLIKLILAIISFSTINYTVYTNNSLINLMNIKTILSIQDMYTELAWRYLLYRYNHCEAVIRFSNLIRCLFLVNKAIVEARESKQYTKIIDTIIEQYKQTFPL